MESLLHYIHRFRKMKIKALKRYFLNTRVLHQTHVTQPNFFRFSKSNEVTFFKECTELLVIRPLILGITVPSQLLVTAILNRKKTLLVNTKSTSNVNFVTE